MSAPVWNGPLDKVTIASSGTASGTFSMPDNALGVLFFIGQITAATTLKLQALAPKDGDQDADVWQDVVTGLTNNAGAIQLSTVSGLDTTAAAKAFGMDAGVLGSGPFRFLASAAQSSGAVTINISWRVGRNRH